MTHKDEVALLRDTLWSKSPTKTHVNTRYKKDKFLKFTIKILSTDTFKQRCQSSTSNGCLFFPVKFLRQITFSYFCFKTFFIFRILDNWQTRLVIRRVSSLMLGIWTDFQKRLHAIIFPYISFLVNNTSNLPFPPPHKCKVQS